MSRLIVVGIGTEKEHLTMGAVAALRGGATVVLHTQRCGAAEWLREQDISFRTLDALYRRAKRESRAGFPEMTRRVAQTEENGHE